MFPKSLVVKQYLNGEWIDLIRMPVEDGTSNEDIEESIGKIKDLIFEHDKVNIRIEEEVIIFNRLDGPIRLVIEQDATI